MSRTEELALNISGKVRWNSSTSSSHYTYLNITNLHCTAIHWTTVHCTALLCIALHWCALQCTVLHCTALHCTEMAWDALSCSWVHMGQRQPRRYQLFHQVTTLPSSLPPLFPSSFPSSFPSILPSSHPPHSLGSQTYRDQQIRADVDLCRSVFWICGISRF